MKVCICYIIAKTNIYALFKQASSGDATGERPGMTDFVNRAFDIDCTGKSVWMPGVLSRKKQVAAPILAL